MTRNTEGMPAQAEAGVWLVSECPIENGTLLKTERVVSLHATADEALSEVRRQGQILRDNDLRGYLYGYKFYPVPGLLAQQPAPVGAEGTRAQLASVEAELQVIRGTGPKVGLAWRVRVALALVAATLKHVLAHQEELEDRMANLAEARAALSAAEAPAGRDT